MGTQSASVMRADYKGLLPIHRLIWLIRGIIQVDEEGEPQK